MIFGNLGGATESIRAGTASRATGDNPLNFIAERARAVSLRVLIAAIAVLALTLALLASQARYLSSFFAGPQPLDRAALVAANAASELPHAWVTLTVDDLHETGMQEIAVRKKRGVERSRRVSAEYYVAQVDERLLLVKVRNGEKPTHTLTGTMAPIERKMLSDPGFDEARAMFLPLMLDTRDYRSSGYVGLGLAALAMGLAVFFGVVAWRRVKDPERHPALRRMAAWDALPDAARALGQDIASREAITLGGYVFTPRHLYRNGLFKLTLENLDDLVWAYPQQTRNKVLYVIPAGSSYALELKWADRALTIPGKQPAIMAILMRLANHQPWVFNGYDEEWAQYFARQKPRAVTAVRQRREEILAEAEARREETSLA